MPKVHLMKKSALPRAAAPVKKGAGPAAVPVDFVISDNGDSTCTVLGVDAAGNSLDISSVATLSPPPASSDVAVITVDAPSAMTFALHAVGPLSTPGTPVQITATATWTDGSVGPYTFSLPCDVVAGAATGVVIQPGTPTVH